MPKITKKKLPQNPYAKYNRLIVRLNNEEMQVAITKAFRHFGSEKGALSEMVRDAITQYKGPRK